ncbi:unnamed protein product [Rotaria sp. Silwood2]|nr:unnamed protein product [Rotaria sp. Silwood2]CAF4322858.1 unnamed protein product [Rotaria sp. Silwood2]
MPKTEQAKDIMLNKCKDYHRGNKKQMKQIEHFRNTYTSNQAIYWYTRDSFIYRLVNRAFRTENITLWYLFRYYVIDLCTQLENVYNEQNIKTCLTLYHVSNNGFFSSSTDINIAKKFIQDAVDTDDFKVIMFEITVDGSSLENTIFVDIDKYTKIIDEREILFNISSIFKIEHVSHDSDLSAWIVKMTATDEGTDEIKKRIEAKKRDFHKDNINLMFDRPLLDMNEYTKAESYFQMLLQVLPTSHKNIALIYDHIAIGNYSQALEYYTKTLQCKNDRFNMARTKLNIDAICAINNDCDKARNILQQIHSCSYDGIIHYQGIIGDIYSVQNDNKIADEYYITAFEMSKKYLLTGNRLRVH